MRLRGVSLSEFHAHKGRREMIMQGSSSIRSWAFWAGVIGLVTAWSRVKPGDSTAHVWIELVTQAGGFAAFGALLAYSRTGSVSG